MRFSRARFEIALCTAVLFCALYLAIGHGAPDWAGYRKLYDQHGAWLRDYGRDPLFVWLLNLSEAALGAGGYAVFRALYFAVLAMLMSWCVYRIPEAEGSSCRSRLLVVFACAAIFLLEILEFIREGLSFLLVLMATLLLVEKRSAVRLTASAALAIAALTIHLGSVFLVATIVAAFGLKSRVSADIVSLRPRLLALGLLVAGVLAAFIFAFSDLVARALHGFAYNALLNHHVHYTGILYWLAFGVVLIAIIATIQPGNPGARAEIATVDALVSLSILPGLYALSICLLFFDGYTGTLRGVVLRVLFAFFALCLFCRLFRGQRDPITFGAATFLLVTETITLVTTRSTGS